MSSTEPTPPVRPASHDGAALATPTVPAPGVDTPAATPVNTPAPTGPSQAPVVSAPAASAVSSAAAALTAAATATAVSSGQGAVLGAARSQIAIADAGWQGPPQSSQDDPSSGNGRTHRDLTGRLARLRIGSHTVSRPALAQIRVATPGTGLILGMNRHGAPLSVRFFRAEPTRVALVGGAWAAQLVAFRAFAVGAFVAVSTTEPQAWLEFAQRATGRPDRLAVIAAQQTLGVAGTPQQPLLIIDDLSPAGPGLAAPPSSWQTQLMIMRHLDPAAAALLPSTDLAMLQRLDAAEAALAGRALRLSDPSVQFLQTMADAMLGLVFDGAEHYVSVAQTEVERAHTGAPRR
jgi:hypothetical protein